MSLSVTVVLLSGLMMTLLPPASSSPCWMFVFFAVPTRRSMFPAVR